MSGPTPLSSRGFSGRRLLALVRKEGLQVVRDPSAILIAFVLPVILLFLFAYAVSLDIRQVPIGVVLESDDPSAQSLAAAFSGTRYFQVTPARDRRQVAGAVAAGELKGFVVIPADFAHRLVEPLAGPLVEIITDGSQPNNAGFVANYAEGVVTGLGPGRGPGARPRRGSASHASGSTRRSRAAASWCPVPSPSS